MPDKQTPPPPPDEQPRWDVQIQTEAGTYEKYEPAKHDRPSKTR